MFLGLVKSLLGSKDLLSNDLTIRTAQQTLLLQDGLLVPDSATPQGPCRNMSLVHTNLCRGRRL